MKKLFTFCATALLAFTLSAQVEQAQGSWYLGTGSDATSLLNMFNAEGVSGMEATIGYAVKDDWIVSGTITDGLTAMSVTYFTQGFGMGVSVDDLLSDDRELSLSAGKMMMLGSISDKLYLYPNVSMGVEDQEINTGISFGLKF
tara:strand:+ start:199 stop:630 length:432 start_codon:yes stop_codon:yes gene_type:complete